MKENNREVEKLKTELKLAEEESTHMKKVM